GVIDLEEAQGARPFRLAVGEGVESGAEHQKLPHSAEVRLLQPVLRVATAGEHMRAQRPCAHRLPALRLGLQLGARTRIEQVRGDWIEQHLRLSIEQLVYRAQGGDPDRGLAEGALTHSSRTCLSGWATFFTGVSVSGPKRSA